MSPSALQQLVATKRSMLCVGLDPDLAQLPTGVAATSAGVLSFLKVIIEATAPYAVAYKLNLAFFEVMGPAGWQVLQETLAQLPPHVLTIADAKRADIGNTSLRYAEAFFTTYGFDALTVAPYMGQDSVEPFLQFADKWTFLLTLTSNPGAADFQLQPVASGPLYQQVIASSWAWPRQGYLGYVVGATQPEALANVRKQVPAAWLLVPGVGAQGASLQATCQAGVGESGGMLINASRAILTAGSDIHYASAAARVAKQLADTMGSFL